MDLCRWRHPHGTQRWRSPLYLSIASQNGVCDGPLGKHERDVGEAADETSELECAPLHEAP